MAKKKDVNIDELDDESGKRGKLVSILVAMLIIVIWLFYKDECRRYWK